MVVSLQDQKHSLNLWISKIRYSSGKLRELDLKAEILGSIYRQIRFLFRNIELDLKGNHLLRNCKALIWAGRFFAGRESAGWLATGQKILKRELKEQILSDGMHYERSPAYHLQVLGDLLECYRAIDSPGEKKELAEVLRRLAAAA